MPPEADGRTLAGMASSASRPGVSELPASRLDALQRQQALGYKALRFAPALEAEFRASHIDGIVPRRLALVGTALLLIGLIPLQDLMFLHPPAAFVPLSRWAQFGFMIPALLIAGAFTLAPTLRRWSDTAALIASFIVCAGVIYQRHAGAAFGYHVPSELVAVVLTGTAIMAGLRTIHFAPTVLAILALSAWSEIQTFGANSQSYYTLLAQGMVAVIAVLGAGMEEYFARAHWLQRSMLEELTLRDPLSGLVNARGLSDIYRRLFATAVREHRPLLVIAVDIDHFKAYNDYYGHLAGDGTLRRVADELARHGRRGNDIAARTGGEEFVLVWYDVTAESAVRLLEGMRYDVERLAIPHAGAPQRPGVVTVSVGAVCAVPGPRVEPETLLQAADEQLYLSKQRGRNCVSLRVPDAVPTLTQPPPGLRPS